MDESTATAVLPDSEDVSLDAPASNQTTTPTNGDSPSIPSRSGWQMEKASKPSNRKAVLYRYGQDAIAALTGSQSWEEFNSILQVNSPHLSNAWFSKNLQDASVVVNHVVNAKAAANKAAFDEKANSFAGEMFKKTATAFADKISQIQDTDFMVGVLPGIIKRSQQNGEISQEDLAKVNGAVAKSNVTKAATARTLEELRADNRRDLAILNAALHEGKTPDGKIPAALQVENEIRRMIEQAKQEKDPVKHQEYLDSASRLSREKSPTESVTTARKEIPSELGAGNPSTFTTNVTTKVTGPRPNPVAATTSTDAPAASATGNAPELDEYTAREILTEAGGDKNKARDLARQRGYKF